MLLVDRIINVLTITKTTVKMSSNERYKTEKVYSNWTHSML